jgi:hypothetical protein
MKTFYVVQMIDGKYLGDHDDQVVEYRMKAVDAFRFKTREEALENRFVRQPFTVIEFYR